VLVPEPKVALVVTVLDEAETIDPLLASVAAQTRPPDEVVVVDGGSSDGTHERLGEWTARLPLRRLREPGASISRGRNKGIAACTAELVAVTDAGVRLDERWLERLLAGLREDADVVSGFFVADPRTVFERALGATTLPARADVRAARFLPSSRSVLFRRAAWEAVGGYPEWLDYGEDLVFDLALKRHGSRFAFAPTALVYFRPRRSLGAFFRQYYRYARGDGKAGLWPRRHAVRYAAYLTLLVLLARATSTRRWPWLLPVVLGAVGYTRRPYARLKPWLRDLDPPRVVSALALVPVIRLVGDVAKMLGYPVGRLWRLRHPGAGAW
jgi:glycosyltransferase involved in cell wall biosynthesis